MPKKHAFRALIVDDEADIRELLEITLNRMGGTTLAAANVTEAKQILASEALDLCFTDMRMPDGSGFDVLQFIQEHRPELPTAVITAYGNVPDAVESLQAGAFDFVSKPVNLQALKDLVNKALKLEQSNTEAGADKSLELVGKTKAIEALRSLIEKLARSQAPVYISGESGTGKERVARLIHAKGPRSEGAFVPVNCGAIPAELMESEFFGHIKGSFTGAVRDKTGLFAAAEGGTLFLDEIAELPKPMQVKLLRAIQERRIRPVGSENEVPIDVRILCATHKNLGQMVEDGQFRQDLYYRINVIEAKVPALRERREDIAALSDAILAELAQRNRLDGQYELSTEATKALNGYSFPGNIRELENILER
ncbi:MAG: sigma-54-dependent transcriptional regulator, partial [Nevskiales bacterium]